MSKIIKLVLLPLFITSSTLLADDCETLLLKTTDRASTYDLSTISPIRETQRKYINQSTTTNGVIISFGSGGDILNPITTFITAGEYHLVDILNNWGAGPGEVILEVTRRLEHISANKDVKVISNGFTNFVSPEKLQAPINISEWDSGTLEAKSHFGFSEEFWAGWGWPNLENFNPEFIEPLILEFTLADDPSQGLKRVYLHPLDYENIDHLTQLIQRLKIPLKGIFITGASIPSNIELFIDQITPQGYLVLELFQQYSGILLALEKSGRVSLFPPHMKDYKDEDVRIVHFQKGEASK